MARSKIYDFEVNNFEDVRDHLDALWYELNKLIAALSSRHQCGDPPNTCGFAKNPKKSPRKSKKAKK
jgi:hypothetical protein